MKSFAYPLNQAEPRFVRSEPNRTVVPEIEPLTKPNLTSQKRMGHDGDSNLTLRPSAESLDPPIIDFLETSLRSDRRRGIILPLFIY